MKSSFKKSLAATLLASSAFLPIKSHAFDVGAFFNSTAKSVKTTLSQTHTGSALSDWKKSSTQALGGMAFSAKKLSSWATPWNWTFNTESAKKNFFPTSAGWTPKVIRDLGINIKGFTSNATNLVYTNLKLVTTLPINITKDAYTFSKNHPYAAIAIGVGAAAGIPYFAMTSAPSVASATSYFARSALLMQSLPWVKLANKFGTKLTHGFFDLHSVYSGAKTPSKWAQDSVWGAWKKAVGSIAIKDFLLPQPFAGIYDDFGDWGTDLLKPDNYWTLGKTIAKMAWNRSLVDPAVLADQKKAQDSLLTKDSQPQQTIDFSSAPFTLDATSIEIAPGA